LAAWILLFFSGCFYTVGRCCISNRGPSSKWGKRGDGEPGGPNGAYAEQMRMEAVRADEERKAMQTQKDVHGGGGLPAFYETVPLTGHVEGTSVYTDKDESSAFSTPVGLSHNPGYGPGGYAPAPQGSRAVDEYYHSTPPTATPTTYPPRPEMQASATSNYAPAAPRRQQSGYTPTSTPYLNASPRTSPPPPTNNQYLSTSAYHDPHTTTAGRDYGHTVGGSSCASLCSESPCMNSQNSSDHTATSQYNDYSSQPQPQTSHYAQPSFNPDVYNSTGILNSASPPPMPTAAAPIPYTAPSNPYTSHSAVNPYTSYTSQSPPPQSYGAPRHQYTLGGDGYGAHSVPTHPEENSSSYFPYSGAGASSGAHAAPINPTTGYGAPSHTSPVKGSQPLSSEEAPPGYDAGTSGVIGHWSKS
jgi:hypothetical protein